MEPKLNIPASFTRSVEISYCGKYRYMLGRTWDDQKDRLMYVGLNPSTADALQEDPTIRKCLHFAHQEGFGGFDILNIYAYRTPHPKELFKMQDPIGPKNSSFLKKYMERSSKVVLMWGTEAHQHEAVQAFLTNHSGPWYCFGENKDGSPRHVLYIAGHERIRELQIG
ncbi:MAG: DUF1643 domain-containing protein [Bacteroidota bacterium]